MGLFGSLLKLTVDVATTPVAIVKDVVTLGGSITDEKSAVKKKIEQLDEDLEDLYEK